MLNRLNHVAIAVPDLVAAVRFYRDTLGASVSEPQDLPDHSVRVAFVDLPGSRVELLEPLGEASPIAGFLARNPAGGLHHLCYEVDDIQVARERLRRDGIRTLGDGIPKTGAHGRPVLFLHPGDCGGTLTEIEEVRPENPQLFPKVSSKA